MLTHYIFSSKSTSQESRFFTCDTFSNLRLHIKKIEDKKNSLAVEIEKFELANDPVQNEYILLSKEKYTAFSKLVDEINLKVAYFNEQPYEANTVKDKIDQFHLANELVMCFLDHVYTNIETLAKPRDTRKANNLFYLFTGTVATTIAATCAASFSWPAVLLSAYLADRTCALSCYAAGIDISKLTASVILLINTLEELMKVHESLLPFAEFTQDDQQSINYYEILNVPIDATREDISKAYRTLSLKYHPDKNKELTQVELAEFTAKFILITNAYQNLSDSEKRSRYDSMYSHEGNTNKPM